MDGNDEFNFKPVSCCERSKTKRKKQKKVPKTPRPSQSKPAPSVSKDQRKPANMKPFMAESNLSKIPETSDRKVKMDREISEWEYFKKGFHVCEEEEEGVLKIFGRIDPKSSGSPIPSDDSPRPTEALSTSSLQWKKEQYVETRSSGFGTPPFCTAKSSLEAVHVKMPKWTTEYFLAKIEEEKQKQEKLQEEAEERDVTLPAASLGPGSKGSHAVGLRTSHQVGTKGSHASGAKGSHASGAKESHAPGVKSSTTSGIKANYVSEFTQPWLVNDEAVASRKTLTAPMPSPAPQKPSPHKHKESPKTTSIGSCTSFMAVPIAADAWDDRPFADDMFIMKEKKIAKEVELWPDDFSKKISLEDQYADEDEDEDSSDDSDHSDEDRDTRKSADSAVGSKVEKDGDIRKETKPRDETDKKKKSDDKGKEKNKLVETLNDRDNSTLKSIPQHLSIVQQILAQHTSDNSFFIKEEGEEQEEGSEPREMGRLALLQRKLQELSEERSSESEGASGPSSDSSLARGSKPSAARPPPPAQRRGLDLLYSPDGSEYSSVATLGSDVHLQMAASDSDFYRSSYQVYSTTERFSPDSELPLTKEQSLQSTQAKDTMEALLEGDAEDELPMEERAKALIVSEGDVEPELEDFAPTYRRIARRLRNIAEGTYKGEDEENEGPYEIAVVADAAGAGAARRPGRKAPASNAKAVKGKAAPAGGNRGKRYTLRQRASRRVQGRLELADHARRWVGPRRRSYIDIFQGEVNVIIKTIEGHILVVDLQLLKTLDLFQVEIDAVGDYNFAKKVHYLPQVSFSNAVRVLLWCSYMLEDESFPMSEAGDAPEAAGTDPSSDDEPIQYDPPRPPPMPRGIDEDRDPSYDSDDSWLDGMLETIRETGAVAATTGTSRRSRKGRRSHRSKSGKDAKEKERKKRHARAPKPEAGKNSKLKKRVSKKDSHLSKSKGQVAQADTGSVKLSIRKESSVVEPSAPEDRPDVRALLRSLTVDLSEGEIARLAADADSLGAASMVRALMRELAVRTAGRNVTAIQEELDPNLQWVGLGQLLFFTKIMLNQEEDSFVEYVHTRSSTPASEAETSAVDLAQRTSQRGPSAE